MKKLNYCSVRMALYLWHKWNDKNISEKQIESIFSSNVSTEILGGWFADFYYDSLLD